MAMLLGLRAWFDQNITIAPYTGSNNDGSPMYGVGAPRTARTSPRPSHVIDSQGRLEVASATLMVLGPGAVGVKDRLTMPGGSAHEILGVVEHRGPDGAVWWYEVTI